MNIQIIRLHTHGDVVYTAVHDVRLSVCMCTFMCVRVRVCKCTFLDVFSQRRNILTFQLLPLFHSVLTLNLDQIDVENVTKECPTKNESTFKRRSILS